MILFVLLAGACLLWLTGTQDIADSSKMQSILWVKSRQLAKPPGKGTETAKLNPSGANPLLLGGVNDPLRLLSQRYQSLVNDAMDSLVSIQAYPDPLSKDQEHSRNLLERLASYGIEPCFTGGGFFVDTEGTILTNFQTLLGSNNWIVRTSDGGVYPAALVGVDLATDTALIRIPRKQSRPVRWSYDSGLNFGQPDFLVGLDLTEGPRVLSALVSSVLQSEPGSQGCFYGEYYILDRARNEVQPGWLVVSIESGVVGMVAEVDHLGGFYSTKCAVLPSELIRPVSEKLRANTLLQRAYLGAMAQELNPQLAGAMGIKPGDGVLISGIVPESPAALAGMQAGDLVTAFGDVRVSSHLELRRLTSRMVVGARVPVEIFRNGAKLKLSVILKEHPGGLNDLMEEWLTAFRQSNQNSVEGSLLKALTVADTPKQAAGSLVQAKLQLVAADSSRFLATSPVNPGEFILEINGEPVDSRKTFEQQIARTHAANTVILRVESGGQARFVALQRRGK